MQYSGLVGIVLGVDTTVTGWSLLLLFDLATTRVVRNICIQAGILRCNRAEEGTDLAELLAFVRT